jgi:TM2 domain-containing membrane protein YozV
MYCNNCGVEVTNDAKFCGSCGKPVSQGRFCSKCGAPNKPSAKFCDRCGAPVNQGQEAPAALPPHSAPVQSAPPPQKGVPKAQPAAAIAGKSPKSRIVAAILSVLFGQLGLHRLYAGKKLTAILQLVLAVIGYVTLFFTAIGYFILALLALWILLDFVMIFRGRFKDAKGLLIS